VDPDSKAIVNEEQSDDGGVDSKLAVILLWLIKVDADESTEVAYENMIEVFATLDVAMAVVAAEAAAVAEATLQAALIFFAYYKYSCPIDKHLASPSSAEFHHCHGMSRDYQSFFSESNNHWHCCGYHLRFDQNLWWILPTPSPIPWSFFSF
jgi:hypothetical protein